MLSMILSNSLLTVVTCVLLRWNRNWHFRSLLIMVLGSNLGSILRHTLFASSTTMEDFLSRVNVWLNLGIGYFAFLILHDLHQNRFVWLKTQRLAFIRTLTLIYGALLLYFLTQSNFIISMISYGLPVILMLVLELVTRPMRGWIVLGASTIIASSLYLSFGPRMETGVFKPADIYHYGLAVGLIIVGRALNSSQQERHR